MPVTAFVAVIVTAAVGVIAAAGGERVAVAGANEMDVGVAGGRVGVALPHAVALNRNAKRIVRMPSSVNCGMFEFK